MEKKEIINNLDGCMDEIRKGICDMLNMMPEPGTDIGIPDECMYDRLPEPAGVSPVYDDAYIKKLGDAVRKASAAAYITHMLYGVTGIKSWPFIDFRHEPVVCLKDFGKARAKKYGLVPVHNDWYIFWDTCIGGFGDERRNMAQAACMVMHDAGFTVLNMRMTPGHEMKI